MKKISAIWLAFGLFLAISLTAFAQETTGTLQGTVKDPTGAVIPGATVTVSTPSLVGIKSINTDSKGYYHISNLPPGSYTITVDSKGFDKLKRTGLKLEVGHEPTVDLTLSVGSDNTTVEVTSESPQIDVTSTTSQTNITQDVIEDVPHGRSFQSVIQFAPSARQEPLQGNSTLANGTGGSSPGNSSNGSSFGYSVAGGADSENSYLVEGQETADVIGGYSHTDVPFDFIQEEEMKTSGVVAEYRGALGGVVNVVMKKGANNVHGSVFLQFENSRMDGTPVAFSRYDPTSTGSTASNGEFIDPTYQNYQPIRDKMKDIFPGFTLGGPIFKDHLFFFVGGSPEFHNVERFVNFSGTTLPFSSNTQTYFLNGRLDGAVTQRLHLFASYLGQSQRRSGESLPYADSNQGLYNTSTSNAPSNYSHTFGYDSPNTTLNFGADYTITHSLVATTRFGYFFANYHDFGYPTSGNIYEFEATGAGATDVNGNPLPGSLQENTGYTTQAINTNFTHRNAEKHRQFDEDISWFKSGWAGTHNFKFGYQLNEQSNDIFQGFNAPLIQVWPGSAQKYAFGLTAGKAACQAIVAKYGTNYASYTSGVLSGCSGTDGYETVYDFGTGGKAISYNHAFYAQDTWTFKRGVTVDAGLRIEKENLPAENQPNGKIVNPINFGWGDKIAPRVGAAWDVYQNGKLKVYGDYGVFYDVMKLNLAISSFGGQYWNNCAYAMFDGNYTNLTVTPDANGRYCPSSGGAALLTGGTTPSDFTYLENQNLRQFPTTCSTCSATAEGVAPGLKPYQQHESSFGVDYQINPTLVITGRYDRRRLDRAIEDSSLYNPNDGGETFVVVNPGYGVNSTFNGFWNFLYGTPPPACTGAACPPNGTIPAARSYDGVEFRLTKTLSHHWFGLASYTYSDFRGNYTGLTSSDLGDGGGGRNAPNNSRSFDEPFFQWNAYGGSSSGRLPTDRPNVGKGYAYYSLPWGKLGEKNKSDFGIFQTIYQGSPMSSYLDVGYAFPGGFPTFVEGRGKWVDVTQNTTTGAVTIGNAYARRTGAYTQTDFNFKHTYTISEGKAFSFDVTATNLLNQRAVTAYNSQIDSNYVPVYVAPVTAACGGACNITNGTLAYAAYMHAYDYKSLIVSQQVTINSQYGKPYLYQQPRGIRLQFHYSF